MGLFHSITHAVSDGFTSAVHGVEHGVEDAAGWVGHHWKGIATFAVSAVTFAGIVALAAVCPFAVPALVTLAVAGVGSGVAGQAFSDWLDGKTPGKDLLFAGAVSGALTVATWGAGKLVAPYVAPVLERVAPALLRGSGAAAGDAAADAATNVESTATRTAATKPVQAAITAQAKPALLESVHPAPPTWLQERFADSLARMEAGEAVPNTNLEQARAFLHETYEHINEVNAILDEMGSVSHPIPATIDGTIPHVHDFGERVPFSRLEALVQKLEANPLKDRATGETVPVPDWIKRVAAEARASGASEVDVSKLNPYVASGLGRSGPADPYSIAFHNLSDHHFAAAFENPDVLAETIADRIDAMRQVRIYKPQPMSYDKIRTIISGDIDKGILPPEGRDILERAIAAEQKLERTGVVNPYHQLETTTSDTTVATAPAPTEGFTKQLGKVR